MTGTAHQPMVVRQESKHWTQAEVPFTIKIIFVVLIVVFVLAIVGNL